MKPQNDSKTLLYDVVLIMLGVFGTIGCFVSTFAIPIDQGSLLGMLVASIVCFFLLHTWHKKFRLLLSICFACYLILVGINFETFRDGCIYIMNCILKTYQANSQYSFQLFKVTIASAHIAQQMTVTLWFLFVPIIMMITYTIRQRSSYFLSFMITIPFLFSILLFTLVPPWIPFIMMLLFYMAMVGMHVASRYDAHSTQDSIRKLGCIFTLCCMLSIVLIQTAFPMDSYVRDPRVDALRLQAQTSIRDMLFGSSLKERGKIDLMSAKNRFYIGNSELKVKSSVKSTIYLHGYSGTFYLDNTWYSPELSYYESKIDFTTSPHPFDFTKLYYEQFDDAQKRDVEKQDIEVTYEDAAKTYMYTPYYTIDSLTQNEAYTPFIDAYLTPVDEERNAYQFSTLVQEEPYRNKAVSSIYTQPYRDGAMFTNITVPSDIERALRDIKISNITNKSSVDEKTKAIQSYMQSFGTYTLSPGETPPQKDFIEYFLETKQGYCVHYASMATMLLRMNGVPARYAEGYRVDSADFEGDIAIAKDYNAHAWVEVFDDQFGWVPLEVTPASAYGRGTTNTTLQNQDEQIQSQNQINYPKEETPTDTVEKEVVKSERTGSLEVLLIITISFATMVLAIGIRRSIKVRKKEERFHQENRKEAVLEVARDLAYFVKDEEIVSAVKSILEEARFSTHQIHEEQYILVMQYLKIIRKQKYTTFTWRQKIVYIWWYCV